MSHRVLIIHPHPGTRERIAKLLAPVEVDVRCAGDFRAAVEAHFEEPAHLVITPDIDVPEQKHGVVSGVRKASARLATIVLVPEIPDEGACPKAARLLTGPQMYLPWPSQADDLPAVVRSMLFTANVLGVPADTASLRQQKATQVLRETLEAFRATGGNLAKTGELLGLTATAVRYRMRKLGYFSRQDS